MKIIDWLKGKKTYILATAAIVAAWAGYWAGTVTLDQAIAATGGALGFSTLRSGITTETGK